MEVKSSAPTMLDCDSPLCTVEEFCNTAHITQRAGERMCRRGVIRAVKCGRVWRIPRQAALEYLGLAD